MSAEQQLAGDAARLPWTSGAAARQDGLSYRVARRALDLAIAVPGLIVLSPILLLLSLLVRLDSPGPAIFRQTRVGHRGRRFTLYKYRGMYVDAKTRFPMLYDYSYGPEQLTELRFHQERDPRVTRMGAVLRRTSLDELPNLWNVVRGDMSLVGPRPEIPEMMPYYGELKDLILSVKPGVTSLAKCSGRDNLTFAETLVLDRRYVETRSLRGDLRILAITLIKVIRRDDVY